VSSIERHATNRRRPELIGVTTTLAILAILAISGCSGGDGTSLTLDQLRTTGASCPVDLDAALSGSGLSATGTVEVEVARGREIAGDVAEPSVLEDADAVLVMCSVQLGEGSIEVNLVAARTDGVANIFLPALAHNLDLDGGDLGHLVTAIELTSEGTLVDLPGSAPVALARIDIKGAESASVYVAGTDGPSREEADALAHTIIDNL
jgi:hypothetical protein